jgi:hypothetical protein
VTDYAFPQAEGSLAHSRGIDVESVTVELDEPVLEALDRAMDSKESHKLLA